MADEEKPVVEEEGVVEDVNDEEVVDIEADDKDDEFEYDADGNIIIPDIVEDEEVDETEAEEETVEETDAEADETDEAEEAKPDEKDEQIAALTKELEALKKQGKETLKKLGIKEEDVLKGLEEVAAESDEVPVDEYRKNKAAAEKTEEAQKTMQATTFAAKMQSDLEEVQKFYPETKKYKSITEIPNFNEFAKLSDKGLSPKQAYIAANPDSVQQSVAASVKQKSLNDTKAHLKSAVPKASKDNSVSMPKGTLKEWRDLFPGKTDKELVELYKQSI